MATSRKRSPGPRTKRKAGKSPRPPRKEKTRLGEKLARLVVAIARERVEGMPLGPEPQHDPKATPASRELTPDKNPMTNETMRDLTKRRWHSKRPFEGMRTEAIVRKLTMNVLTVEAKHHALRELALRDCKFL